MASAEALCGALDATFEASTACAAASSALPLASWACNAAFSILLVAGESASEDMPRPADDDDDDEETVGSPTQARALTRMRSAKEAQSPPFSLLLNNARNCLISGILFSACEDLIVCNGGATACFDISHRNSQAKTRSSSLPMYSASALHCSGVYLTSLSRPVLSRLESMIGSGNR